MYFSKPRLDRSRRRRAVVSFMFAAFIFLYQPEPSLAQANPATWMSDQSDYIANVPMKGIAMLGSHDAAMYVVTDFPDIAKNQVYDFTGQLYRGVRWFDTRVYQLKDISTPLNPFAFLEPNGQTTQFLTGVPFSLTAGNNYYLYGHGGPERYSGVTLAAALDQVSHWLDQHPKEIVILELVGNGNIAFSPNKYPLGDPNVNDLNTAAAFEAVLDQHLRRVSDNASYIYDLPTACALAGYPYTVTGLYRGFCSGEGSPVPPQEVTPQQLYTTSARVILLEQYGLGANLPAGSLPKLTWVDFDHQLPDPVGHERLTGYFGNGSNNPTLLLSRLETGSAPDNNIGLYGYRPRYQSYESDNRFLAMQAEITPFGDGDTIDKVGSFSPMNDAAVFNPILNSVLQTTWQPYSINIVSIDRSDDENVLPNLIAYNQTTFGRVPSGTATPTQVVAGRDGNVYKVAGGRIWKRTGSTGQSSDWTSLGTPADHLAVAPSGTIWPLYGGHITLSNGTILLTQGYSGTFTDIASDPSGTIYTVGSDGNPYIITGSGNALYATQLPNMQHNFTAITAGPSNTITAVDASGNVWQTSDYYSSSAWHKISAEFQAKSITADDAGNLWATSSPGNGVWRLLGGSWTRYRGDGVQVSVGPIPSYLGYNLDLVYVLSQNGTIHNFRYSLSTGLGAQAPPPKRYAATVSVSGLTFDHATQLFTGTLTVTNNTGSPITDQLAVVFQGLSQGVTIANNPLTYQNLPFILMPSVTLQPGDSTSMQVQFSDPNLVHINYLTEVFAYVAGS